MQIIEIKGNFKIIDYRISHKLLLIRSTEVIDGTPFNTDIIFKAVFYLEIPDHFEDLVIGLATDDECNYVKDKCYFQLHWDYDKVYKLQTSNKNYYIGCWDCKIQKNNLLPLESSLVE